MIVYQIGPGIGSCCLDAHGPHVELNLLLAVLWLDWSVLPEPWRFSTHIHAPKFPQLLPILTIHMSTMWKALPNAQHLIANLLLRRISYGVMRSSRTGKEKRYIEAQ